MRERHSVALVHLNVEVQAAERVRQVLLAPFVPAGIVHRDLKLENMILENERDDSPVKIADFVSRRCRMQACLVGWGWGA